MAEAKVFKRCYLVVNHRRADQDCHCTANHARIWHGDHCLKCGHIISDWEMP